MRRNHMKITKIVLSILTVALITSQLTGCAIVDEDVLTAEANDNGGIIEIEMAVPKEDLPSNEIVIGDKVVEIVDTKTEVNTENKVDVVVDNNTLTMEELHYYFKLTHASMPDNILEESDIGDLAILVGSYIRVETNKKLPDNWEAIYQDWVESLIDAKVSDPFTFVDEELYVTNTVNIREFFNTDSNILGQLDKGTKVIRVGIGYDEAEGWSKLFINDEEVYVSTQYLSYNKPTTNNNTGNSGSTVKVEVQAPVEKVETPTTSGSDTGDMYNYDDPDYTGFGGLPGGNYLDITGDPFDVMAPIGG